MCYDSNSKSHIWGEDEVVQYTWFTGVYISTPFVTNVTSSVKLPDGSCVGLNPSVYNIKKDDEIVQRTDYAKQVYIDINSSKGPNIAGEDLFFFVIDKNSLRPYGYDWSDEDIDNPSKTNSCNRRSTGGGLTCAARIIREGWQINY